MFTFNHCAWHLVEASLLFQVELILTIRSTRFFLDINWLLMIQFFKIIWNQGPRCICSQHRNNCNYRTCSSDIVTTNLCHPSQNATDQQKALLFSVSGFSSYPSFTALLPDHIGYLLCTTYFHASILPKDMGLRGDFARRTQR